MAKSEGKYAFYRSGNVVIHVWRARAEVESGPVLSRVAADTLRLFPAGISVVHWLTMAMTVPSNAARNAFAEVAKQYEQHGVPVGLVLDGDGFWASAFRGVITSLMVNFSKGFPLRMFANMDELLAWLPDEHKRRTGATLDPQQLRACVEEALR